MFQLPYQTTICSMYPQQTLDKIKSAAAKAELTLPFPAVTTPSKNILKDSAFVTPQLEHEDIPTFTQLINISDKPNEPRLLLDSRQYMKYDQRTGTLRLVANNDWTLQCIRLALTARMLKSDEGMFNRLGDLPAKVFHKWVSGPLITRYSLPVESQMAAWVISTYYYYAMSIPELGEANFTARQKFAPIVSRITGVPPDFLLDTIEKVGTLKDANDLITELSTNTYQERTGKLKFMDLFNLLASSWVGVNGRENVGVALEHLPTFIAMLFMGIADRSYRKTVITQRAESVERGNELKVFQDLVHSQVTEQYVIK